MDDFNLTKRDFSLLAKLIDLLTFGIIIFIKQKKPVLFHDFTMPAEGKVSSQP